MSSNIKFPQGPIVDTNGYVSLEWQQWFQNPQVVSLTLGSAVGVASGGTGLTTTPTNGQLLIGNGTGYTLGTLTGTSNQVNVTNAAGSITLSTPQDIGTLSSPTFAAINKVAITQPASNATLTILNGKTFTSNNSLTLAGTDGSTLNIGTGGTLASMAYQVASNVSISGGTIDGTVIGGTTKAAGSFTTLVATGHATLEGVTSTGATGTGNIVFSASPTFSGTVVEAPRASAYQWSTWNGSSSAAKTDAPTTTAGTSTATAYMTQSSGASTLTLTFTQAGKYLISLNMNCNAGSNYTLIRFWMAYGGTATRYITSASPYGFQSTTEDVVATETFLVSATANQTLTILPSAAVTSGSAMSNFIFAANATALYVGT